MKKQIAAALILLLAVSATTPMSVRANAVTMTGFYDTSCESWTQARAIHQSGGMEMWALGFV